MEALAYFASPYQLNPLNINPLKQLLKEQMCIRDSSKDNRAMVAALDAAKGRAKGIAFVGEEVSDDDLRWMDKAGVRGVRFNFLKRLVDYIPRDVLQLSLIHI